ncbi:putative dsRNA-binding protein [Streptomyces sp. NPDC050523]|uniref:putative dsRNA-binding protein n=1 Tax=Streptomyces sp. NPDC050523 TaxID=3365622 RepID=UPI0037943C1A
MSKATLQVLSRVGGAFLQKIAAADIYERTATTSPGKVSKLVAEIVSAFPAWTVEQKWLRDSAALSVGIDRERLSPKVTSILFRQVLGVLCVEGEENVATGLLTDLFTTVRRRQEHGIGDPKTVLQEKLGRSIVTYTYEREGPDHATVFHAVATDTQGRRAEGRGRNKKAASQQAALNFLRPHFPSVFANSDSRGTPRPLAMEIPAPKAHARTVRRLQGLFLLPDTVRPLFSQALIHASWTHENQWAMARYRQQDHQVLAHVGSHVLIYEHSLAIARNAVVDPPDGASYSTLPDRVYDTAFYEAGLSSALLLGVGQRSLGIPEEAGANTFQAVIGAVSAAMDFRGSLADIWPKEWGQIWKLIAPSDPWPIDPTSRLQQAASAMKLGMDFEYVRSGPDHAPRYVASVILQSPALGLETRAKGTAEVGKTPAKHTACEVVLSVLTRLANNSVARSFDEASKRDRALARFLLSQQAFLLDTAPVPLPRWIDAKLFGLHLAPNAAGLLEWAAGVDELLGLNVSLRPDSHLKTVFRDLIESSADPDRTLDTALSRSMDILEQIQVPEQLETPYLQYLVHLCDVHRCLGTQEADINVQELAHDWHVLHKGQVDAVSQPPDLRLSGRERAVLDAALSTVLAAKRKTSVEFLGHRPMRLRFRSTTPLPRASTEEICALWSRVSRTTTLEATECGIDAVVTTADSPIEPGPITQAVEAALQPTAQPYRAAVADLLHDLKNQLVAARSAASQPTEGRTARLQQQLSRCFSSWTLESGWSSGSGPGCR